ncbi:MAG: YjjG family noncanonical pyrimidine nucleotidase [Bacteroidota bacterium]
MYNWLLFDADNTVWDFSAAESNSLRQCLESIGLEWTDDLLNTYRAINHVAWREYEQGLINSLNLRTIRFQRLIDHLGIDADAAKLSVQYRRGLAASDHFMPGAEQTLQALRPHYRMGLITNGLSEVQRPRLKNTRLDDFFDFVLISDEVGVAKPEGAFFDLAFAEMKGARPEEALVIGDNPVSDIMGAQLYGCASCWMDLGNGKSPERDADFTVRELRELESILLD